MFSFQDQFSAATKAHFDAQLELITTLTAKAFEGVEKVIDLNISATKASMEELAATGKQFSGVKDPQEFTTLAASQAQPNADKAVAYSRHLASILSSTQSEFTKAAEAQIAETSRKVSTLIDEVSKNAPPGSENAIAMLKSVVGNANAGYEQLTKSTKQAVETLETNLNTAAKQFTQAAEKTTRATKK
jgi:phasin family protein